MMRNLGNAACRRTARKAFVAALMLSTGIGAGMATISAAQAQSATQTIDFKIAPGPLNQALAAFGRQSGLQVTYLAASASGKTSAGITGRATRDEALARILTGSGLVFSFPNATTATVGKAGSSSAPVANDGSLVLDTIDVNAGNSSRTIGWDGTAATVFTTPAAVAHISSETLEHYPSNSPSDMLRSQPGVLSGESRNSGGLDVNIRGLQGQGRTPVTVDGAMNATAVYRGYQGIANRSFVDPDFIGGINIEKGPSTAPGGAGAIGGTVNMTTINADDIVAPGQSIGIRVKVEGGNNTTPLSSKAKGNMAQIFTDGVSYASADVDRPSWLDPTSGSASVVLATKSENFDLVAGFARRKSGNYHAGENGSHAPEETAPPQLCIDIPGYCDGYTFFKPGLTAYLPGEEVLNTSQNSYSGLLKGTFRFADDHTLELGYSHMKNEYGETYPMGFWNNEQNRQQGVPSEVEVNTYTSRYRWNPASELIDVKWNLWGTQLEELSSTADGGVNRSDKWADMWGTDLSNTSAFSTGLGEVALQYGLAYQNEATGPGTTSFSGIPARQGERYETSVFTNGKWSPTNWLQLEGGLRYHSYNSKNKAPGNSDEPATDDALDFSTRVTVMPMDGVQLFGGYKEASRLPSLFEAAGGFATIIDENLKPERAKDWEFGANLVKEGLLAETDSLGLKLAYFNNTIDDYINRRWDRVAVEYYPGYYYYINNMVVGNIAQAKFSGFELSGNYKIGGFNADFAGTYYTDIQYCRTNDSCKNSSLAADYATNYVPPEYSLSLALSQKFFDDRLTVGGRVTYVGPRGADAEPTQSGASPFIAPITWQPYTLLDVFASYQLSDFLMAQISIENLTDQYYVDPLNLALLPSPGRTIKFSLTGEFSPSDSTSGSDGLGGLTHFAEGPEFDWTGLYLGANAAYMSGAARAADFVQYTQGFTPPAPNDQVLGDFTGKSAGIQAGFNYQFANDLVLGLEGDFSWTDASYTKAQYDGRWDAYGFTADVNWMATVRAKAGVAVDRLFVYGSAGLTAADVDQSYFYTTKEVGSSSTAYYGDSKRMTGWTVGAGVEYAMTRNWTLKGEYNFVNLDRGAFENESESFGSTRVRSWRGDLDIDQVRVGVNYKF
jgi:hemoglobin/transferrin/lactoferrin receptor protein